MWSSIARAALRISVIGVLSAAAACHDDRARVDQFELALVETTRSTNGDVASTVLDSNGRTVATMRWSQDVVVARTAHEPDADLLPVESPTSLAEASRIAYRLWLGSR
ncbi:MAG: hypothetical protein IT384_06100 [Deltaproteobacteria bacterium]|nr:hypothetical protein [Deltaproteobacteria bacterium]